MAITSASAVSSLSGPRPTGRKFKLKTGGRIMATRGKKQMSSRRGSKRTTTRGKKKKR